ncbi:MAG: DUF1365 domain-containing protein [bacterium]|nr:DUF1365 domain-containing protein [bacterium]
MNSCLYRGHLRHRRFVPVENDFKYGLFLVYIDLSELPDLFRGRWLWSVDRFNLAWFRRKDYLGDPSVSLDRAVRDRVAERVERRPAGPIRMLTHLRYFGYCFNPVTFYYCYDTAGDQVETIVAEIQNTPWGEKHAYVLDESDNRAEGKWKRYEFSKNFHVSPYMAMDMAYDWRFLTPGDTLNVHMNSSKEGEKFFDATLTLRRAELTRANLARVLAFYPFMTVKVTGAIYWQALRLLIKGAPFHGHPGGNDKMTEVLES